MSENFGLKIGLEGEKEFKKSLAEINNSFKVLGSEMKLVDSQFDKNDKSTEALTARSEVLNKEIDSQKQKIETLRSALANAAESFGENDRRTQSWQIQLNNAQAALNGMERELSSNNTALEKADKGFDEAGDERKYIRLPVFWCVATAERTIAARSQRQAQSGCAEHSIHLVKQLVRLSRYRSLPYSKSLLMSWVRIILRTSGFATEFSIFVSAMIIP